MIKAMKKYILTFILAIAMTTMALAQAKKPTIMVVPSQTWCNEYGYTKTEIVNGGTKTVPDYERAFLENGDMKVAITTIGNMMVMADYPLKDMEQYLNSLSQKRAEDIVATSKQGANVALSPLDIINQRAKADIIFDLYWKVNTFGPNRTLTYNLRVLDAYTNKQIGGANGTSRPSSSSELAVMLQDAATGTMGQIEGQIEAFFGNMQEMGREVALEIRLWDNCPYDLEEEFGGKELNQIIEEWMDEHTVKGRYSVGESTETRMDFEQVRIPLYDERDRAIDATRWARGLASYLKSLGIESKVNHRGLGCATITIGGK